MTVAPESTTLDLDTDAVVKTVCENGPLSDYYQNLEVDYEVADTLFAEPSNRKIRIINVGTGLFSISLAYHISTRCENFALTLFEKSNKLGGVWHHNQYPGIACDVPSHIYQYNWAPNPEWPRFLSSGDHIQKYLDKVSTTFDLKKYMQFNTEVVRADWHDEGFWRVLVREKQGNGEVLEYYKDAEILVNNSGTQHKYQWPKIEGLNKFKGKLFHTAEWDPQFTKDAWKDKSVAVLGSGASGIQVVPQMQPHVKKITIFVRTPVWFAPGLTSGNPSPEYTVEEREEFKRNPETLVAHAKSLEQNLNKLWGAFRDGSEAQKKIVKCLYELMRQKIRDPELLKGFTPYFPPGCRRVTPGDPFIEAVQQPNAEVVFKSVTHLTEGGAVDGDGIERKFDAIICATGFDVNFLPLFEVFGKNGLRIADALAEKQDNYMALAFPGFPNYYCGSGPYWTVSNGSLINPTNAASMYVVQVIQKLQKEHNIISVAPTEEAMNDWVEHAQAWVKKMVWARNCPSWYKVQNGPFRGRSNAIWPGITLHMVKVMERVRWEDFHIEYQPTGTNRANRFKYLGYGMVKESVYPELDDAPHISLGAIDPRWTTAAGLTWIPGMQPLKAVGMEQHNTVDVNGPQGINGAENVNGTVVAENTRGVEDAVNELKPINIVDAVNA